jgi:hypothetical protein
MKFLSLFLALILSSPARAATHDYVIDNATGANFRTDINNALSAIVSQNSNSTAPTTTYAYMVWADTTAGVLKIRNAANNAWVQLWTLAGVTASRALVSTSGGAITNATTTATEIGYVNGVTSAIQTQIDGKVARSKTILSKTANYTVLADDYAVNCNTSGGAFTITLPSAASVSGRDYIIKKTSSDGNALTVSSSDSIDGSTSRTVVLQSDAIHVISDGTTYRYVGNVYESYVTTTGTITNAGTSPSFTMYAVRNGRMITVSLIFTTGATGSPTAPAITSAVLPAVFRTSSSQTANSGSDVDTGTATTYAAILGTSGTFSMYRLNSSIATVTWANALTKTFNFSYVKTD